MAQGSVFGLRGDPQKGAFSLQSIAARALGSEEVDPEQVPTSPFAAIPNFTGAAGASQQTLPISQADLAVDC